MLRLCFTFTVISLNTNAPIKAPIAGGNDDKIVNATGSDNDLLVMNQLPVATAHINPDSIPGNTILGYKTGLLRLVIVYRRK